MYVSVVGVGRVESICQAIISSIPENVRVNNETVRALTDEPLTYSKNVFFLFFFLPDVNKHASDPYILQLVLAGIEETEGTAASRVEYKLSVG